MSRSSGSISAHWPILIQVVVVGIAALAHPRPAPEVSAAVGDAASSAFVVAAIVAGVLVIAASALWSQRSHLRVWAIAIVAAGVAAATAHVSYLTARTARLCDYRGQRVIIGTALTTRAETNARQYQVSDCVGLLDEYAGVRTDVWQPATIKSSETRLTWLPAAEFGALLAAILAAVQLAGIRIARAPANGPQAEAEWTTDDLPPSPEGLNLTPGQLERLSDAIRDAFPDPDDLDQLLTYACNRNRANLTLKDSYPGRVHDILMRARAEGWLRTLVTGAIARNPDNPKLRAWAEQGLR